MKSTANSPLVSVMMPAYNAASFIKLAIESICVQTYTNWELICYDDGSTDDTVAVVEALATNDPRIRLYRGIHGGRGKARNAALQHCTGEFIAMCDADDISLPNRFAEQIEYLTLNPAIDAVGAFQIPFKDWPPTDTSHVITWPTDSASIGRKFDALRMAMPNCVVMIRRHCFDRVGGFDEALLRSQDFGFFLKLHRSGGQFANLAKPLIYYRQEGNMPSFAYWLDSEKYHAMAIVRAGSSNKPPSLSGRFRRLLSGKFMLARYTLFKARRTLEIWNGKKG